MGIIQVFTRPGPKYEQSYFEQLVNGLNKYVLQMANPGPMVCATLQILQVPHSGYNLANGSVWSNSGVLYIVEANNGYPGTVVGTGSVGTVTVTTV